MDPVQQAEHREPAAFLGASDDDDDDDGVRSGLLVLIR